MTYSLEPVAIARTPFAEKFGIPRQSGLVPVRGSIELLPPYNRAESVVGLESVSHIWLDFIFHQNRQDTQQLSVRPPRLGGNRKLGVFATRASFRPNRLGTSLVRLEAVQLTDEGVVLEVSGIDLLDGTPIVDIKPYLPYADSVPDAVNGIASQAPAFAVEVTWAQASLAAFTALVNDADGQLAQQVVQLIGLDPRPAYKKDRLGSYGMCLFGVDIRWDMQTPESAIIVGVEKTSTI